MKQSSWRQSPHNMCIVRTTIKSVDIRERQGVCVCNTWTHILGKATWISVNTEPVQWTVYNDEPGYPWTLKPGYQWSWNLDILIPGYQWTWSLDINGRQGVWLCNTWSHILGKATCSQLLQLDDQGGCVSKIMPLVELCQWKSIAIVYSVSKSSGSPLTLE